MKLLNFAVARDNIAVEQGGRYFDLHNNFDFLGLEYSIERRELSFRWVRGSGDWVPQDSPEQLCLSCYGVYLFRASEREADCPFTEDSCLSSIGFMWDSLVNEMGSYHSNEPKAGCTHLSIDFMSGFAIKVGAESAMLQTSPESLTTQ